MRFCDKLPKVRKNNNLSQEQLADRLGVSRQAVSKWESGSSYPDMDKMIQMCKILDCELNELMDDGILGDVKNDNHAFQDVLHDFLNFITKTYNMFWAMSFKEKIKCLFEIALIVLIMLFVSSIIVTVIDNLFLHYLNDIPTVGLVLRELLEGLVITALIVLGMVILIHLFKIRYLNYYITIEDNNIDDKKKEKELPNEKVINNKRYIEEKKREKIVIRDPKHSSSSFLSFLGKIAIIILKILVIIFIIPLIICYLVGIFMMTLSLINVYLGTLFLWIALAFIGALLIGYDFIYGAYCFIFNRILKLKLVFVLFIVGLVLIGGGVGLAFNSFLKYDISSDSTNNLMKSEEIIEMKDNLIAYWNDDNVTIDNSLNDIKIIINYPKNIGYQMYLEEEDGYVVSHIFLKNVDLFKAYKLLKEDIKDKKIYDYTNLDINVYISQANYDKIKNNIKTHEEQEIIDDIYD